MEFDSTSIFYVVLMAVVQGVAEFLPISSSGHLLVLGKLFHLPEVFTLSILLHAGTLLSVVCFFFHKIWEACTKKPRVILLVIVGSIPTVIIAFTIMKLAPQLEENLLLTGCLFIVTGVMLMTILKSRGSNFDERVYFQKVAGAGDESEELVEPKTEETTTWLDAFLVGVSQGFAALPGLSRSGTTISAGLLRNFDREWAGEFSFLLSIPVIAGGAALELLKVMRESEGVGALDKFASDPLIVVYLGGAGVSFVVGWFALGWLMRMLREGCLHNFAWWLFLAGPCTIGYWVYLNWSSLSARFNVPETATVILQTLGFA